MAHEVRAILTALRCPACRLSAPPLQLSPTCPLLPLPRQLPRLCPLCPPASSRSEAGHSSVCPPANVCQGTGLAYNPCSTAGHASLWSCRTSAVQCLQDVCQRKVLPLKCQAAESNMTSAPVQVLSTCNPITIKAYAEAFANATVNIAGQGCNPIYFTAISREYMSTYAELPVAGAHAFSRPVVWMCSAT